MTELLTDPGHSRSDLKLAKQAIVNGWDIPEKYLSELPKIAGEMAISGNSREKLGAMQVLLKMKEQNDKAESSYSPGRAQNINVGIAIENVPGAGRRLAGEVLERLRSSGVSAIVSRRDQG